MNSSDMSHPAGGEREMKINEGMKACGKNKGSISQSMNSKGRGSELKHRKKGEILKDLEAKYRAVVESSFDAILTMDTDRNIVSCNNAFVELFGYDKSETEGKSIRIIHPSEESFRSFGEKAYAAVKKCGVLRTEWKFKRKDGTTVAAGTAISALKNTERQIIGYIAVFRDITEHQQAEKTLIMRTRALEERVKELNCFFNISNLVEKRHLSLEEILRGIVDVIPPAMLYPEITCVRLTSNGQVFQTKNFKKTMWGYSSKIVVYGKITGELEVYLTENRSAYTEGPFFHEEKRLLSAISERIGRIIERIRTRQALRESEKRFRDLVENCPTGILIVQDGKIVYRNPEQEKIFRPTFQSSDLTNLSNIHEEDVDKVSRFLKGFFSEKISDEDIEFRYYPSDENGNRLPMKWVYCRANKIDYHDREAMLINVMDVSKLKEMERLLQIQDKMSSLGHVAAGIAHEIRNPLSGINIYLTALERLYEKPDKKIDVKEIFGQIHSASNKIAAIVKRVMDFSKPVAPKFESIDINMPIQAALDLSSVTLRKRGISVKKDLASAVHKCNLDANLIEEVIMNLITNATDALKKTEEKKMVIASSLIKNRIVVTVADSGPGVPPSMREKVFDPFCTTKNDGTGLGLSICRKIITDHGGSLSVSSSNLGGAEFKIELPLAQEDSNL